MSFSVTRPYAFYLLLLVIPAVFFAHSWFRRLWACLGMLYGTRPKTAALCRNLKRRLILRTIFWVLAWISLVLAFSGLFWGTEAVPVQKTGKAVSFVFDISYSMTAQDVSVLNNNKVNASSSKITRLQAVSAYVQSLLPKMQGTSLSAVIAKGDGIIAVPLTEDTHSVEAFVSLLSPELMTSAGSCIGKGIDAAVRSFPSQTGKSSTILVFTDGEETDGALFEATKNAASYGIPVIFIGFGSLEGAQVLAGDGETLVQTSLKADALQEITDDVIETVGMRHLFELNHRTLVQFVEASSSGSAIRILEAINGNSLVENSDDVSIGYEIQPIPRHRFFTFLAIILFIAGYCIGEINFSGFVSRKSSIISIFFVFTIFTGLFSGCSLKTKQATDILVGKSFWHQEEYRRATSSFLHAAEDARAADDSNMLDYALFGLSVSYYMQNEFEAAREKLVSISPDASPALIYAVNYNSGIIAYEKGDYDQATQYFRDALISDSSSIEAKVNYELSIKRSKEQSVTTSGSQEMIPASENNQSDSSILENSLYSIIRENDQKRWKNQQSQGETSSADDY